jgi:hypothetical protein
MFYILALPETAFARFFALDSDALAHHHGRLVVADASPGYPCRVSLQDAAVGEALLLVNYTHHDAATPFRSSHAVYVRAGAVQARPVAGAVPEMLRRRTLSLRAFDRDGMLQAAALVEGISLGPALQTMLEMDVDHVDIHFAKQGCYAARAVRA